MPPQGRRFDPVWKRATFFCMLPVRGRALARHAGSSDTSIGSISTSGSSSGTSSSTSSSSSSLDDDIPCDGTSLVSALMMQPNLTTYLRALRAGELMGRLNDVQAPPVTLFVADDSAWQVFAADAGTSVDALLTEAGGALVRHLLLYGLVPTPLSPQQLAASPVLNTSWAGQMVFVPQPFMGAVSSSAGTEARITGRVKVCESYAYRVAYVLMPALSLTALPAFSEARAAPPPPPPPPACANASIPDLLSANGNLTTTLGALQVTGLEDQLYAPGVAPYTLFAPTDAAWEEAAAQLQLAPGKDVLQQLNRTVLRSLLLAHLLPGNLPGAQLRSQIYTTAAGTAASPIFLSTAGLEAAPPPPAGGRGNEPDPGIALQTRDADAVVVVADVGAVGCTASVHAIDAVLLPDAATLATLVVAAKPGDRQQQATRKLLMAAGV
ncbi:hypothetical protein CHLRE_03g175300v5 [Chlamydomonas reinhardtii]|uniref:FAS1 domain-containing protein n=1 Tax=Chlamydomonas reinhardtii TaxID=3055 RepID=A0A2K3DXD1_CHLRE|nr:uncharacterized protein CHLRE_03g175300v5 [Chlamydomonas reinhardtii]PNW85186.1 hypothetical protein CHLRE_03g175300v5 [Chlamydomonas reinhardtii]